MDHYAKENVVPGGSSLARTLLDLRLDNMLDSSSRDTLSSIGTTFSEEDGSSWDEVACRTSEFVGFEENDPMVPLVQEEVKEAVLLNLPQNTLQCITSDRVETIMEGMLFKKGRAQLHSFQPRNWKYRYFKLQSNGELSYYKNHHKRGSISLAGNSVQLRAGTSFRTCIEPKTGKSNSTEWRFSVRTDLQDIVLAARTKNEMQKWLTSIRQLCEAKSIPIILKMNLEIEVHTKSLAELEVASPRTLAASQSCQQVRRRAKSCIPPRPPRNMELNSHHYDTFSPKAFSISPFEEVITPRGRSKTENIRTVFAKSKDWNERDGVLRIVRINDVPPTVYQPKYTMRVCVNI